ncbi:MAG: ABC transporter substrate-binding protein, partial [Chloroflexales bacterium]
SDKVNTLQYTAESIKALEQGLGVRITTGLHKGCIRLLAGVNSGIKTVADLKGKSLGITNFGGLPQVLVQWALGDLGLNPVSDVTYKIFPGEQLESAVQKGEIDAFALYDPIAAIALNNKTVIQIFSTQDDLPYKDMYCCFIGVSQKVVDQEPEKAIAITNAFQKAAYWVEHNKPEAAKIITAKKYVPASEELLLSLLKQYDYIPSAEKGKVNFGKFVEILKRVGVLEKDTDPAKLTDLAFVQVAPDLYPNQGSAPSQGVPQFSAQVLRELAANPQLAALAGHDHAGSSFYCNVS